MRALVLLIRARLAAALIAAASMLHAPPRIDPNDQAERMRRHGGA